MELSNSSIKELKAIIKKEYWDDISVEGAKNVWNNLISLFTTLISNNES